MELHDPRPAGPGPPPLPPPARTAAGEATLRVLEGPEDYRACYELQRLTWGRDFEGVVSPSVLKIIARAGGVVAGAFAADGRLLAFVLGLSGVRPAPGAEEPASVAPAGRPEAPGTPPARPATPPDRPATLGTPPARPAVPGTPPDLPAAAPPPPEVFHWSHMLAVDPAVRDLGLGRRLKVFQRELLLAAGISVVEWTFDPLEARNANLNLNILGAEVAEYVEDMYKGEEGSELARGIGTDRFVVSWRLSGERVLEAAARGWQAMDDGAARFAAAPRLTPADLSGGPEGGTLPAAARVAVEVPARIQELKAAEPELALAWRLGTRRAFQTYLAHGYRVSAFFRDAAGRCFYGLETGAP